MAWSFRSVGRRSAAWRHVSSALYGTVQSVSSWSVSRLSHRGVSVGASWTDPDNPSLLIST